MIFSIIMPVYNAEKTLDKTIQSVLQQTTKDFEFIIVDDGSCDESHKIVSQYAQEDGRVKARGALGAHGTLGARLWGRD